MARRHFLQIAANMPLLCLLLFGCTAPQGSVMVAPGKENNMQQMIVFSAKNWEGKYWSKNVPNGMETTPCASGCTRRRRRHG